MEKRKNQKNLTLLGEEKEKIENAAARLGLSFASFLRASALEKANFIINEKIVDRSEVSKKGLASEITDLKDGAQNYNKKNGI